MLSKKNTEFFLSLVCIRKHSRCAFMQWFTSRSNMYFFFYTISMEFFFGMQLLNLFIEMKERKENRKKLIIDLVPLCVVFFFIFFCLLILSLTQNLWVILGFSITYQYWNVKMLNNWNERNKENQKQQQIKYNDAYTNEMT